VQRQPDISLAVEKLGWKPVVPLKEGLAQTIGHFEKVLSDAGRPGQPPVSAAEDLQTP
jgi:UDP-glucuronate decarboxylase